MTHTTSPSTSRAHYQLLPHILRIAITLILLALLVLLLLANPPSVQAKATPQPDTTRNSQHLLQHTPAAPTIRHAALRSHIDEASYMLAHEHESLLLGAPAAQGVKANAARQP